MGKYYSLGIKVQDYIKPINPKLITNENYENLMSIVKITGNNNKETLKDYLSEITEDRIDDVVYITSNDPSFENFDVLNEKIKYADSYPYFQKKNNRLLFSFKKNYYNTSFQTGLLSLAIRKYDLDKDYKKVFPILDIEDDYKLVDTFFREACPNRKCYLDEIRMARNMYLDALNSNRANVYNFDVEKVKEFIISYISNNANSNNASKNLFALGSYLYKFDRSVAFDTNKDITSSYEYGEDEYITSEDTNEEVIETDFYPYYKKNKPSMSEEEYYSQKR